MTWPDVIIYVLRWWTRRNIRLCSLVFAEALGNTPLSCIGPKLLKLPEGAALSFML